MVLPNCSVQPMLACTQYYDYLLCLVFSRCRPAGSRAAALPPGREADSVVRIPGGGGRGTPHLALSRTPMPPAGRVNTYQPSRWRKRTMTSWIGCPGGSHGPPPTPGTLSSVSARAHPSGDPIPVSSIPSVPRRLHLGRWGTWTFTSDPPPTALISSCCPGRLPRIGSGLTWSWGAGFGVGSSGWLTSLRAAIGNA